jgi:polygalacturonase
MRALQRTARRDWPAFLALRWLGIWIITGLLHPLLSADLTRDVTTLGVSPDGMTLNTQALQRAIDSVSGDGGGILRFPPGHYRCGSILLKDCVTLQLDCGAVLQGSCDIADYRVLEPFLDGTGAQMGYCFIGAVDAKHIGIIGTGLIDGRGAAVLASRAAGALYRRDH